MEQQIYSVTQINTYIQSMMDSDRLLSGLCIRGEISNYKVYPSGHHYFSLKDATGALRCVMFKSSAIRLRFRPENGMKVLALGKISVFPRDGAYQLYCTNLTPDGVGDLHVAFEQLKAKLQAEGLFDPSHKKPLPRYPGTIAIITSSAGAAVHDMLRILRKRYPLTKVLLLPVRVQGVEAPAELCGAIRYVNRWDLADLIITGRGGGSLEDLWAFNDESLARTISQSRIPVISAVGHETDFTICDFAADLRAPTPSAAAELAVPDMREYQAYFLQVCRKLKQAVSSRISAEKARVDWSVNRPAMRSPLHFIEQKRILLDTVFNRLNQGFLLRVSKAENRLSVISGKLDALSPFRVLGRGYSLVLKQGSLIKTVNDLKKDDGITVKLSDGEAKCQVIGVLPESKEEIL